MKVSVLIPVYGVEKYITRCAESLMEQTYEDVEYVFIDDGSTDKSIEKLQAVTARYPQRKVRVIRHTENRGLGAARKTLVMEAQGEYILNVDSDDYLETDAIEQLVEIAERDKADIVAMNMWFEWEKEKKVWRAPIATSKEEYIKMLLSGRALPGVWRHMIKRALYFDYHLWPTEGLDYGEDYCLIPRLCYWAKEIRYTERPLYHYIQTNSNSYTHQLSEKNIQSLIRATEILVCFFEDKKEYADALQQGLWQKKIDVMMLTNRAHYALVEQIKAIEPMRKESISRGKYIVAVGVTHRWYTLVWLYSRLVAGGMWLIQRLKGR